MDFPNDSKKPSLPGKPRAPAFPDIAIGSVLVGGLPWKNANASKTEKEKLGDISSSVKKKNRQGKKEPESAGTLFERFIRSTPAWTVSLSVHMVVVLILALWNVHHEIPKTIRLTMSFNAGVDRTDDKRVDIPSIASEEIPEETEIVMTNEPPVEDPEASPSEVPTTVDVSSMASHEAPLVMGTPLAGREPGSKQILIAAHGGGDRTEQAVGKALEWLARQQNKKTDLWSLTGPYKDGGSQENQLAASAMALLAFQGAGNTINQGPYRDVIQRAWGKILAKQNPDGVFEVGKVPLHHKHYSHAQITIALCEMYGMTKNPIFEEPARRAIAYAINSQGPDGGWRYEPGKPGDMSMTGWFMMALKSAEMAEIPVPAESFVQINNFLDLVAENDGARYGYQRPNRNKKPVAITKAVSAEGLLCRQYLGWKHDDPRLIAGVELLLDAPLDLSGEKDFYAWYYVTQVCHHIQGSAWKRWNSQMRDVLPDAQVESGSERGSWDPALDHWGSQAGRIFTTCMATYMLEVYYRHLPIYQQKASQNKIILSDTSHGSN